MARMRQRRLGGFADKLKSVPKPVWFALGIGVVGLVVFSKRKTIGAAASSAAAAVSDAAFRFALPEAGKQYADDMLRVAKEKDVSPWLIAAFMEQESGYGVGLRPPGPAGVGDAGHGRGLMQIDDRSHAAFLAKTDSSGRPLWTIPYENIKYGVGVLLSSIAFFKQKPRSPTVTVKPGSFANQQGVPAGTYPDPRPLEGDALLMAAVAGYNTGMGNALQAVAAGMPADQTTTKRRLADGTLVGYATSVLSRLNALAAKAQ
jgi:hypothetical protein